MKSLVLLFAKTIVIIYAEKGLSSFFRQILLRNEVLLLQELKSHFRKKYNLKYFFTLFHNEEERA